MDAQQTSIEVLGTISDAQQASIDLLKTISRTTQSGRELDANKCTHKLVASLEWQFEQLRNDLKLFNLNGKEPMIEIGLLPSSLPVAHENRVDGKSKSPRRIGLEANRVECPSGSDAPGTVAISLQAPCVGELVGRSSPSPPGEHIS